MDIELYKSRLANLEQETPAKFGKMTPQHMVEHLILTVKISYERIKIPEFEPSEKLLAQKQALLFTDIPFPLGVRAPGMEEGLLQLKFPNLGNAKEELQKSLDAFEEYFIQNPNKLTVHPRFGKLSFTEWKLFHPKHFEHHFNQFGI